MAPELTHLLTKLVKKRSESVKVIVYINSILSKKKKELLTSKLSTVSYPMIQYVRDIYQLIQTAMKYLKKSKMEYYYVNTLTELKKEQLMSML